MEPFTVALPDGRTLSGALYGPADGAPLFYFHGLPGCRREPAYFAAPFVDELRVRVVALERPGYGHSDPQPGRTLLDWPKDVAAAADHLGVARFAVLGYSGGGAYALACAYALPDRVTKATVLQGLGALDGGDGLASLAWWHPQRLMLGVGGVLGPVLTGTAWCIATAARNAPRAVVGLMSKPDRALAARRPDVVAFMAEGMFGESLRQGMGAAVQELRLAIAPWGFPVEDIRVPVRFVHGREDTNCTPDMAEALHARVPESTLELLDDAGHLVLFDRSQELLRDAA